MRDHFKISTGGSIHSVQIEKGIKIPIGQKGLRGEIIEMVQSLEIEDSILMPTAHHANAIRTRLKKMGRKGIVRQIGTNSNYRVWRVK